MTRTSAGLLLYRWRDGALEVFLVHPGGPFWARKDDGAWSVPKGEYAPDEDPLPAREVAVLRAFFSVKLPRGEGIEGAVAQAERLSQRPARRL